MSDSARSSWRLLAALFAVTVFSSGFFVSRAHAQVADDEEVEAPAAPVWATFAPKVAKFSVQLPGTPKEDKQELDTEAGTAVTYQWMAATPAQTYFVSYSDMPEAVAEANPKDVLEGARDGAVNNVNGKLLSQNPVSLNGVPGIDFSVKVQQMKIRQRIFLQGRSMYQLLVISETGELNVDELNKFLSSFKLASADTAKKTEPAKKKVKK